MFTRALVVSLLVFAPLAIANQRPTLPPPGEDTVLTGGAPAKAFFERRRADVSCRANLTRALESDRAARTRLAELVRGGGATEAIDAAERAAKGARDALLPLVESCGDCAIREIEQRTIRTAGRTEVWYISDGSCQLPLTDAGALRAAYDRSVERLSHLRRYPKRLGGFSDILEFVAVDPTSGALLPEVDRPESQPFFAFIAVRGPEILGQRTAASYYVRNQSAETASGERRAWTLTFQGARPPRGFQAPDVYETSASGRQWPARQMKIPSVHGMWHVDDNGYLRYHTAADFGMSLKFASDLAKRILLDTLVQMSEFASTEQP